jgi:hypothetical protein
VLGETATQTQYWVEAAAALVKLEVGSREPSTDVSEMGEAVVSEAGTSSPSSVVGRMGVPRTLVKPASARAVKKRADFILVLWNWRVGMCICRGS